MSTEQIKPEVVASKQEKPAAKVDINPAIADLINDPVVVPEPVQVEADDVVFVAFEDFEGRINQANYAFVKGVPVRMPREEANNWLDAKKGYIK